MVLLRLILKYCSFFIFVSMLVLLSMVLEMLSSDWMLSLAPDDLYKLGKSGLLTEVFLLSVLAPVISATLVIGILGGTIGRRCIDNKPYVGFIIASILGLIHVISFSDRRVFSSHIASFIILLGIPAFIFAGGMTYAKICKWSNKKIKKL